MSPFIVSDEISRLDLARVHQFLSQDSYWATQIPFETFQRGVEHSHCFGVYTAEGEQIGFARVISDYATFAYIDDVFILAEYRGQGLAQQLLTTILAHPRLQRIKRWLLATRDAHGLYNKVGFVPLARPDRWMEIHDVDIYSNLS